MNEALILIDIQMDYFKEGGMFCLEEAPKTVNAANKLLNHFRSEKKQVIHIMHENPEEMGFLVKGSTGAELHKAIQPISDETVIRKQTPNAFFMTELEDVLRTSHIEKLTVIGFMANMCVDATVRAAKEKGFTIELVPEAIAALSIKDVSAMQVKTAFLGALEGFIAHIVPLEQKICCITEAIT